MCGECNEINETAVRYRRLKGQIGDHQLHEVVDRLLATLETKKAALHSE